MEILKKLMAMLGMGKKEEKKEEPKTEVQN